jgi:hypothetical protein
MYVTQFRVIPKSAYHRNINTFFKPGASLESFQGGGEPVLTLQLII